MEIEYAFDELNGELKVLDMKAEDGFVKRRKRKWKRSCDSWRRSMTRDCEVILKISPFWRNFQAMNFCKWAYRQRVTANTLVVVVLGFHNPRFLIAMQKRLFVLHMDRKR